MNNQSLSDIQTALDILQRDTGKVWKTTALDVIQNAVETLRKDLATAPETLVDMKFRDGDEARGRADEYEWGKNPAWKVLEAAAWKPAPHDHIHHLRR